MQRSGVEWSLERRVWLWSVMGPLLVLSASLLSAFRGGPSAPLLAIAGLLGIPLCTLLRLRGWAVSMALLVGVLIWSGWQGHLALQPWVAGVWLAIAVGFLVCAFTASELHQLLEQARSDRVSLGALEALDQRWKRAEKEWRLLEGRWGRESEELQGDLLREREARHIVEEDMRELYCRFTETRKEMDQLERRLEEGALLRKQLNELRAANFQLQLDLESVRSSKALEEAELARRQSQLEDSLEKSHQTAQETQKQCDTLQNELKRVQAQEGVQEEFAVRLRACRTAIGYLKQYRDRYRQLRSQFEQKQAVLDQTRAELFLTQEKLQSQEMAGDESRSEVAYELVAALACSEQECRAAEAESEHLQEVVGGLLEELSRRSCLPVNCLEALAAR